jgi:predicted 2-oxoglutarate/Fe(II)-dependent dioxygenase YbiX
MRRFRRSQGLWRSGNVIMYLSQLSAEGHKVAQITRFKRVIHFAHPQSTSRDD